MTILSSQYPKGIVILSAVEGSSILRGAPATISVLAIPPRLRRRIILTGSIDDEHNRLLKIARTYADAGYQVHFVGMDRLARRPKKFGIEGLT